MTRVTARQVTAAMRTLHPRPVRLSVRRTGGGFLLRVPRACDTGGPVSARWLWLAGYLSRRLGCSVMVTRQRVITRHDCGHDVEFLIEFV